MDLPLVSELSQVGDHWIQNVTTEHTVILVYQNGLGSDEDKSGLTLSF